MWLLVGELFHPLQEMQPIYLARRCPNLALRQISIGVRQLEAAQLGEVARHAPRLIHGQHAGAPGRSRRHNQSLGCDAGGGFTGVRNAPDEFSSFCNKWKIPLNKKTRAEFANSRGAASHSMGM